MADTKIKDLTSRTPAVGDQIPINDISGPDADGQVTVGAVLDIINGKVNVDSSGTSSLSAASTDLSDTANIALLDAVQTVTGAKTFGSVGAVGKLKVAGTTSGTTIIDASAVAGTTTVTLPAATDTLVGKATTDTLTNKTIDADGTGNSITNIENADIKAAAAIAVNKLAALTASQNVVSDGSGFLTTEAKAVPKFCMGWLQGSNSSNAVNFNSLWGAFLSTTEAGVTVSLHIGCTLRRITVNVNANTKDAATVIGFRDDTVTAGSVSVTASTTGEFDSGDLAVTVATGSKVNGIMDTSGSVSGAIAIFYTNYVLQSVDIS